LKWEGSAEGRNNHRGKGGMENKPLSMRKRKSVDYTGKSTLKFEEIGMWI
jgi:hypothetical protein